ncbi:MAG: YihY/virulence factor BrkB family protein [Calditrichia bacterium]
MRFPVHPKGVYLKLKQCLRYYLTGLYHRLDDHHVFLMGGGLTFSLFTCLLPLVLIIFYLMGILVDSPRISEKIVALIDLLMPYQKSSDVLKGIILSRINEFRIFKTLSGIIGGIGIFFAASGLFSTLRTILNSIFRVDRGKSMVVGKLRDFGMVIFIVLFLFIMYALLPAVDILISLINKIPFLNLPQIEIVTKQMASTAVSLFSFVIVFFLFFSLYYLIPYEKLSRKVVGLSALFAAVFWSIAKELYGIYVVHAANLNRIYGAYVFIVVSAFWIYYSSVIFIIGAEIGQLYRENRSHSARKGAKSAELLN